MSEKYERLGIPSDETQVLMDLERLIGKSWGRDFKKKPFYIN